jgi:hypothetical protein
MVMPPGRRAAPSLATVEERHRQVFQDYEAELSRFSPLQLELVEAAPAPAPGGLRRMRPPVGARLAATEESSAPDARLLGSGAPAPGDPGPGPDPAPVAIESGRTGTSGAAEAQAIEAEAARAARGAWDGLVEAGFARLGVADPGGGRIAEEVQGRLCWPFPAQTSPHGILEDGALVALRSDLAIVASMQSAPLVMAELFQLGRAGEIRPPAAHLIMYFGARPPVTLELWKDADDLMHPRLVWIERALAHLGLWCGLPVAALDASVGVPGPGEPPAGVPAQEPMLQARQRWTAASEIRAAKAVGETVLVSNLIVGAGPHGLWVVEEDDDVARWTDPLSVGNRINDLLRPEGIEFENT